MIDLDTFYLGRVLIIELRSEATQTGRTPRQYIAWLFIAGVALVY